MCHYVSLLYLCDAYYNKLKPDERPANRTSLFWSGMTDAEHSTTSGSNEENCRYNMLY